MPTRSKWSARARKGAAFTAIRWQRFHCPDQARRGRQGRGGGNRRALRAPAPDIRGFAVSLSPEPLDTDTNDVAANEKDAVLNIMIGKPRKDSLGRTLVARDRMKRKPPE